MRIQLRKLARCVGPKRALCIGQIAEPRLRRTQDAIASFRRAIGADAEFTGAYSNLALVLEQTGELKEAGEAGS